MLGDLVCCSLLLTRSRFFQTPTVIVINVVLGVGVVILSSALAVLYLGRELGVRREGTTRGSALGEIETHVGVLLVLSAGLLGAFNWFIAGLKGEESGSQSENDRDRDCDNEDTVDRKIQ